MSPLDGQIVQELRTDRGLRQVDLAKKAKLRQALISEIERGVAKRVTVEHLDKLAKALGVEASDLLVSAKRKRGR